MPPPRKDIKSGRFIIVFESETLHPPQDFALSLGLKTLQGFSSGTAVMLLCQLKVRIRKKLFKTKLLDFLSNGEGLSFPEYNGVLACSGTDEKIEFNKHLLLIKAFDEYSDNYISFDATITTTVSPLKQKADEGRYHKMAVKYAKTTVDDIFTGNLVFEHLNILKIETYQDEQLEDGTIILTAIFKFERKQFKNTVECCILDYNRWFPETPIKVQGSIVCLNRSSKEEMTHFSDILAKALYIKKRCWIKYLGTVSTNAYLQTTGYMKEVAIIYHQKQDETNGPCFLKMQENGEDYYYKVFESGRLKGVIIAYSDIQKVQIQDNIFILLLKLKTKTSAMSMFNQVLEFVKGLANNLEFSLEKQLQQPSSIPKCGIYVKGDPEYAMACHQAAL